MSATLVHTEDGFDILAIRMGSQVDGTPDSSESLIVEEYMFSYRDKVQLIISCMRWKS